MPRRFGQVEFETAEPDKTKVASLTPKEKKKKFRQHEIKKKEPSNPRWGKVSKVVGDLLEKIWYKDPKKWALKKWPDKKGFTQEFRDKQISNTRENVRTLYGLIPDEYAGNAELALNFAPIGKLVSVYRGAQAGLKPSQLLAKNIVKGKKRIVNLGGGEYPGYGKFEKRPLYTGLSAAEPSSYPRDLTSGRELYKYTMEEDVLREYAHGFRNYSSKWGGQNWGVSQWKFDRRLGMEAPVRGPDLHAVFMEGLPMAEVDDVSVFRNVEFPENPHGYYQAHSRFLGPNLSDEVRIMDELKDFARKLRKLR